MTLREITRRPKKALARRSDIDDEPVVQVQRLDTRMGSGLFCFYILDRKKTIVLTIVLGSQLRQFFPNFMMRHLIELFLPFKRIL